jgi:hypothetical protein
MQPSRAVFLSIFHRIALSKRNNPCEQFETNKILPDRSNCLRRIVLSAFDSRRIRRMHFFFGKKPYGTRSRVILEELFAVDFACGGAYPSAAGAWSNR